jgi:uncharacterized SAM-binding protein YcdF (DUF218 family)
MSDLAGHDHARAAGARAGHSRARRALAMIAVVVGLGVAAWLSRDILLRSAAEWWIVSDRLGPADVVAVFGGGIEDRPFAAAAYYREGLVKKIALPDIRSSRAEQLGVLQSHFEANRRVLLKLGVPESAIERFGDGVSNTYEEVLALREWAARNGVRSIIVPTEIFSARRVRWMLQRAFGGDVTICVPALVPAGYRQDDWWKHEGGLIGFQNEVIKYLYYRAKY